MSEPDPEKCRYHMTRLNDIEHELWGNGRPGLIHRTTVIEEKFVNIFSLLKWVFWIVVPTAVSSFLLLAIEIFRKVTSD